MDGVLDWTQRQAKALTALRLAKEKSKVMFRLKIAMQFVFMVLRCLIIRSNAVQRSWFVPM